MKVYRKPFHFFLLGTAVMQTIGWAQPPRRGATPAVPVVSKSPFRLLKTPVSAGAASVPNTVHVTSPGGTRDVSNMPFQISRFFTAGEIPGVPGAVVDGQPAPTQADIKTRWPDGSVQHAILSFPITLGSGGSAEVGFTNREPSKPAPGLTREAMLSNDYNLNAIFEISSGDGPARTISVRDLLAEGNFRYWLSGPLVTQVIVEEKGTGLKHDLDWNGVKSFHPIFVLTFYTGQPGVKVEFIAENTWMDRLQDLNYSVVLKTGRDPAPVFEKKDFLHAARSRWRKTFWSGPALPPLLVDHNLPYLIQSRALPNFDLSISLSGSAVGDELNAFQKTDKGELGGSCLYAKYFPTTGGRGDLGPFTRWDMRYLYTFDHKLEQVVKSCAEVSGYVPIHFRESRPDRPFTVLSDDQENNKAFGRVVSVDARPGFCSREGGLPFSTGNDKPVFTDKVTYAGWTADAAHQASFTYIAYLLFGDWYYLEELYFWSAWNLSQGTPSNCFYCRGVRESAPFESFAIMHGSENERAFGWMMRSVLQSSLMAPDGSVEKLYFTDKLLNNVVAQEGRLGIHGSDLAKDPSRAAVWKFGNEVESSKRGNPLYFWSDRTSANVSPTDQNVDGSKSYSQGQAWQTFVAILPYGLMSELGFPGDPIRTHLGLFLVNQLVDPSFNPYLIDAYVMPSSPAAGVAFQNWGEVLAGFREAKQKSTHFQQTGKLAAEFGYGYIALSVGSFLTDLQGNGGKTGLDGYNWLKKRYPQQDLLNSNPKWAIVPRTGDTPGSIANPATWAKRFQPKTSSRSKK